MKLKRRPTHSGGGSIHAHSGQGSIHAALKRVSNDVRKAQLAPPSGSSARVTVVTKTQRGVGNTSAKMIELRKMRKLWNKHLPVLQCSNCAYSTQCPQYKAQYECAFLPFLNAHEITDETDLIFYAKEMLNQSIRRTQTAMVMETLSGAAPSIELGEQMGLAFNQLMQLHERMTQPDTVVELNSDDKTILNGLFGNLAALTNATKEARDNPIEYSPVEKNETAVPQLAEGSGYQASGVNSELLREYTAGKVIDVDDKPA